jgi:integrase
MAIEPRRNKDGTQSFRARVKDPLGKFYRSEWKRNRDEAMAEEADQFGKKRKGEQAEVTLDGEIFTYDDLWAVFAAERRTEVSDGWKISQNQMNRDYVSPVLGKKKVAKITEREIAAVLTRMKSLGRGAQLRKHVYMLMHQVFASAIRPYYMIKESPVRAELHGVKVPRAKTAFLEPKQSWALLDVAEAEGCHAVWIELLAGLRLEATVALKWSDVLWESDQIWIRRAWKSKVRRIEDYPKGKDTEYVPMNPVLKDYLASAFDAAADKTGFVCQGPMSDKRKSRRPMLKPESYGPWLKRLCQKAGVPAVSSHVLRHSCTELFYIEGASIEDLRRLLNHKDSKTTLRYVHRTDDRLRGIAAKIKRPVTHAVTREGNAPNHPQEGGISK